jgi:hypothetical protein
LVSLPRTFRIRRIQPICPYSSNPAKKLFDS